MNMIFVSETKLLQSRSFVQSCACYKQKLLTKCPKNVILILGKSLLNYSKLDVNNYACLQAMVAL